MALSDADVQKQIKHMMAFIEQEANEKAEEIEAKAEEEFNIEKGRLVQEQRLKIMEHYEKKEKQVELQKKIQSSNMLNQARLKVLKSREDHIRRVLDETRDMLRTHIQDKVKYNAIIKDLLLQGMLQLLEPELTVLCRKEDVAILQQNLPKAMQEYSQLSGKECKLTLDTTSYLPKECCGGIEVVNSNKKIKVNNTLETRLEQVSQKLMPEIRTTLFGANMNRQFFE